MRAGFSWQSSFYHLNFANEPSSETPEALCLSPVVPPTARSTSRSVAPPGNRPSAPPASSRLNKFVRGLHQMLLDEKGNGIIDWDKGVLILHSLDDFSEKVLPRYFNTRNFKTFRRQLNYYGESLSFDLRMLSLRTAKLSSSYGVLRIPPPQDRRLARGIGAVGQPGARRDGRRLRWGRPEAQESY